MNEFQTVTTVTIMTGSDSLGTWTWEYVNDQGIRCTDTVRIY